MSTSNSPLRSTTLGSLARVLGAVGLLSTLAAGATGCVKDDEHKSVDGTMKSDGYALFAVDNNRQQRNDVTVVVKDVDPGATYVLIYNGDAPKNVGWFQFDPTSRSRCGGDTGPHCEISGYGYMVDYVKVPEGATEIQLRDDRCGCDGDRESSAWVGRWAVMRVERTNRENPITFDVWARKVKDYAAEPNVEQLQ